MDIYDWAKREVEIACKGLEDPSEFDYTDACFKSALKAFKSLYDDGHSGISIGITKAALNRLIDGLPLTPIEDSADIWEEIQHDSFENKRVYQCRRMFSLFKDVYDDGRIFYNDIDRIVDVEKRTNFTIQSSYINKKVEGVYIPYIKFPYAPYSEPYKVYCDLFSIDDQSQYYGIYYCVSPHYETIEINKYYKCTYDGEFEITKEEFEAKLTEYNILEENTDPKGVN